MLAKEKIAQIDNNTIENSHNINDQLVDNFSEILENEVDLDASNKIQYLQDIYYLRDLFNIKI